MRRSRFEDSIRRFPLLALGTRMRMENAGQKKPWKKPVDRQGDMPVSSRPSQMSDCHRLGNSRSTM